MRKIIKKLVINLISMMMIATMMSSVVLAHSLTPWSQLYTVERAGGDYQFAIGDYYHPDTSRINFYFENSTARNTFIYPLAGGIDMWGGMISFNESTFPDQSVLKIQYNPNIAAESAAYVVCYGPSIGHYEPGGVTTTMVIGNIINYTQADQIKVLGHEVGHVWGIRDLYQLKPNLSSIYSKPYTYPSATQMDRDAMYICLNTPWYYMSSPDRRAKYQKAPGIWARNETLVIQGRICTFDADGYLISSQ